MNRTMIILSLAAALAACGKPGVDERNASVEQVAEAVAKSDGAALQFEPGRWESKVRFIEMKAPGMPPEVAQTMNKALARDRSAASCLSKEAAAKPAAEFFANDAKNCRYDHFTMGEGKLDAKMRCHEGEGEVVVSMNGTYSPTHYAMTMETLVPTGGEGGMTMRMAVDARHAGKCQGNEASKS